jgi:hypothetical protein
MKQAFKQYQYDQKTLLVLDKVSAMSFPTVETLHDEYGIQVLRRGQRLFKTLEKERKVTEELLGLVKEGAVLPDTACDFVVSIAKTIHRAFEALAYDSVMEDDAAARALLNILSEQRKEIRVSLEFLGVSF